MGDVRYLARNKVSSMIEAQLAMGWENALGRLWKRLSSPLGCKWWLSGTCLPATQVLTCEAFFSLSFIVLLSFQAIVHVSISLFSPVTSKTLEHPSASSQFQWQDPMIGPSAFPSSAPFLSATSWGLLCGEVSQFITCIFLPALMPLFTFPLCSYGQPCWGKI